MITKLFTSKNLSKHTVTVAFLVVVFSMGINYIFIKTSNKELPPLWGASLRYLVSALILLAVSKYFRITIPKGRALLGSVIYGVLAYAANSGLLYWALTSTNSSVASVIYSTIPLSTLLLASIFRLEKINRKAVIGSITVIAGIAIILFDEIKLSSNIVPLLAITLASIFAALSGIIIKKYPKSHPVTTNFVAMTAGGIMLFILSLILGEVWVIPSNLSTLTALSWLVTSSTISSVLFIWVIKKWSASKASYVSVLSPIVTICSAIILSQSQISIYFMIGTVAILLGSSMGIISKSYSS